MLRPEAEMITGCHGSARALGLADRPVLRESASTSDGRLVRASVGADGVGATIRFDGTEVLGPGARVVGAVALDDVVFGLRRVDPPVDGEVGAGT